MIKNISVLITFTSINILLILLTIYGILGYYFALPIIVSILGVTFVYVLCMYIEGR